MRGAISGAALMAAMLMLTACPGHVKGVDVGAGFDALDTQSKESKDNEKWWGSYYGKCHNVWGDECTDNGGAASSGAGGWHSTGDE